MHRIFEEKHALLAHMGIMYIVLQWIGPNRNIHSPYTFLGNYLNIHMIPCSVENEGWVLDHVVNFLESEELGYKLCIHNRDFVPGFTICDNICTAIQHSRRLIAVVTR